MFVGGKEGPGLPLHHLADVTPHIISFYGRLARLIFILDFWNSLDKFLLLQPSGEKMRYIG